jgi:enamine deaminase RidA (YjgF/YER057c/UK114 family)
MTQFCLENNVQLLAFGTLAGGFLSEKWLGKPEPKLDEWLTWSQMKYKRFIDTAGGWEKFQALLNTLHHLAQGSQTSIAHLASRYILDQPAVAAVIIGARLGQKEHRADNQRLLTNPLSAKVQHEITNVLQDLEMIPGDCGDEYRKPPFLTASGDLSHHVANFPKPFETIVNGDRTLALSGTIWEDLASFCRAVRKGNRIFVSGTTATHGQRLIGGNDPIAQAHFVIDKIEGAINSLGGTLRDVTRTRIFVRNMDDWEVIARAHGERFRQIQPANTLIQGNLVGDEYLVEMEAEAMLSE